MSGAAINSLYRTTVMRFCYKRCSEHSYKPRLRNEKVQRVQSVEPKSLTDIKEKDYQAVAEVATLLEESIS